MRRACASTSIAQTNMRILSLPRHAKVTTFKPHARGNSRSSCRPVISSGVLRSKMVSGSQSLARRGSRRRIGRSGRQSAAESPASAVEAGRPSHSRTPKISCTVKVACSPVPLGDVGLVDLSPSCGWWWDLQLGALVEGLPIWVLPASRRSRWLCAACARAPESIRKGARR